MKYRSLNRDVVDQSGELSKKVKSKTSTKITAIFSENKEHLKKISKPQRKTFFVWILISSVIPKIPISVSLVISINADKRFSVLSINTDIFHQYSL